MWLLESQLPIDPFQVQHLLMLAATKCGQHLPGTGPDKLETSFLADILAREGSVASAWTYGSPLCFPSNFSGVQVPSHVPWPIFVVSIFVSEDLLSWASYLDVSVRVDLGSCPTVMPEVAAMRNLTVPMTGYVSFRP
jgi:hypothetical protein